ncbi:S49 family peptidase [Methylomicrobium sp. Wu6]|uniref:S49 family peptidase n=1 Tax=Methylomicrobium sp. Wu6 TaxID=3107928 RepID=UPI002DD6978F|nr:S49 family peptidase [Methylomicrobium sp. Wu6]MEC4747420.1 S49 family peptidase [Methylomicrobium sp. Wu6]
MLTDKLYAMPRLHLETLFRTEAKLAALETPTTPPATANTEGNTAVIPVNGVLFPRANIFTLFGFGTALTDIQAQINKAVTNQAVKKIVFAFDSPGGSVTGIHEQANTIKAINKPTVAYVGGMAASAAYWLAAACDQIVTDATGEMGSIGIVGVYQLGSDKNTLEIVSSHAPDKRPDGTTPEGKRVLQTQIDDLEAIFIQSLVGLRPALTEDKIKALRGGIEIGAKAVKFGLADGLGSLQGVLSGAPLNQPDSQQTAAQDKGDWGKAFSLATGRTSQAAQAPAQNTDHTGWGSAFAKARGSR